MAWFPGSLSASMETIKHQFVRSLANEAQNRFAFDKIRDESRTRIICFPYAGGDARAFDELKALAPESIEVICRRLSWAWHEA